MNVAERVAERPAHVPVLLEPVLAALEPRDGGRYVDGTFGRGGYSAAVLDVAACQVIALDRDPAAMAAGAALAADFPGRFDLIHGRFGDMDALLAARGVQLVDGVVLDLGVSSPQLDDPARGFSFRADGPLDMRMDGEGETAADLVNGLPEDTLAELIARYGEERQARAVARAIVRARPITRTLHLAETVRGVVHRSADGIDPATRTFQALRIAVNDELGELERGLAAAERLLVPGGRLAVVTFHSLEDRAVKSFLAARSRFGAPVSRHRPQDPEARAIPSFKPGSKGAIRPSAAECAANPRARSARLRWAVRTEAPPQGSRP
jgi:16S rRNA (cytosine1402-N4)-methyltransferase